MSCKSNLKCPSGVKSVSLLRKNINYFINGVQAWRSWSVHVGVMLVFVLLYQSFCITTVVHCLYKNTWNKLCVLKLFSILTKKKEKKHLSNESYSQQSFLLNSSLWILQKELLQRRNENDIFVRLDFSADPRVKQAWWEFWADLAEVAHHCNSSNTLNSEQSCLMTITDVSLTFPETQEG